ncbi:MAG: CBS domain-containing protein [Gemmatimonadaceae bacterium]
MPTVGDILNRKGSDVATIAPSATVLDAARLMTERGIGGVPVVQDGAMVGVFTERDILRRIVVALRDPASTSVADVMTTPVLTCTRETTVDQCTALMTERRMRHLPVVDESGLCGIVTIGDILALRNAEQEAAIVELNRYIYDIR